MNVDFLIIGGGIAGTSVGAALAPHGSVGLVEQEDHLAFHATGRSAAIFCDSYGDAVIQQLSRFSRSVLAENGPGADAALLSPRGIVHLIANGETCPDHDDRRAGFDRLTAAQVRALIPAIRESAIQGGLHELSAADIDVHALQSAYQRQIRAAGGVILTGERVLRASRSDETWSVVTDASIIRAPIVINAAGAWAGATGRLFGTGDQGLMPTRRSAALVSPPSGTDVSRWPMAVTIGETVYFKPEAGKLMISPVDQVPTEPQDVHPDDYDLAVGIDRFEQLVDMPVTRVDSRWAGLRTLTADDRPVVGPDPAVEDLFWLAGQGGFGIQTAPATAALLAAQILGKSAPPPLADLADAVRPGRPDLTWGPGRSS